MIYLALAAVIWGTSFPVITYALRDTSPMLLLFLRFAIAFAVLALRYRSWQQFRRVFSVDLFLISIPNVLSFILQFKAQELTTASKTALFVNSSPIFVAILTGIFLKTRIGRMQLVATMVAMVGVVVTSTRLDFSGFSVINFGDVLALGVGVCWAVFIVSAKGVVRKYGGYELAQGLYFWTVVMTLPLLAFEPVRVSGASIPAALFLAFFATVVAYSLYLKGAQSVSPLAASIIILIEVVVAFLISHFLLGETFSPVEALGVAMVMTGVILAASGKRGS